jgi:hypothetical protein
MQLSWGRHKIGKQSENRLAGRPKRGWDNSNDMDGK